MKKYRIYFVDCNGYGGDMIWNGQNLAEIKRKLNEYTRAWNLEPISYLTIDEI